MKLTLPGINKVFDTDINLINTVVIENQKLFLKVVTDLQGQIDGFDGDSVLSKDGTIIPINKNLELLSRFVPFEINQKRLINKLYTVLENEAINSDNYHSATELLSKLESFLYTISFDLNCDLVFDGLSISSLIKAANIKFNEEYDSLAEKIIDYIELVSEFDRVKLFVTVNVRSYINYDEFKSFVETSLQHGYRILMIENHEYEKINQEERYIIDQSLCEIC